MTKFITVLAVILALLAPQAAQSQLTIKEMAAGYTFSKPLLLDHGVTLNIYLTHNETYLLMFSVPDMRENCKPVSILIYTGGTPLEMPFTVGNDSNAVLFIDTDLTRLGDYELQKNGKPKLRDIQVASELTIMNMRYKFKCGDTEYTLKLDNNVLVVAAIKMLVHAVDNKEYYLERYDTQVGTKRI